MRLRKIVLKRPAAVRKRIAEALTAHQDSGLWRVLSARQGLQDSCVNFNHNDYLGLAQHPDLAEALKEGAARYGSGAGSANTLSGYTQAHEDLIETLKAWLNVEDVLLFSSGYIANLAVLSTLPSKADHLYMDRLSHASLLDGAGMSEAKTRRYPHQRLDILSTWLAANPKSLVVTESLFGMDGDTTDIAALSTITRDHEALLYIDEAHALGVYGDAGCGLIGSQIVPLRLGTFSKAIGLQGAFVAGDKDLIEYCRQFARPYLFTTALSPAIAHAAKVSIEMIKTYDRERQHLYSMIAYFKKRMHDLGIATGSDTFIQPIMMHSNEQANQMTRALKDKGMMVSSIRYPTVPKDSPRLRVSLNAQHTEAEIDAFIQAFAQVQHV